MEKINITNIDNTLQNVDWRAIHKDVVLNNSKDKKIIIHRDGSHEVIFWETPLTNINDYVIGVLNCWDNKKIDAPEQDIIENWKNEIKEQYSLVAKYISMIDMKTGI
ncbi:MAG: hypothetical protein HQK79_16640 [Desulfobacterales bacterium]|nr:hypothetical protein [Desulfobacterales bacterium]MBF0396087.1 hypothetical protein [Desulfobacterales bacterium]